jgi:hypothetical protein
MKKKKKYVYPELACPAGRRSRRAAIPNAKIICLKRII